MRRYNHACIHSENDNDNGNGNGNGNGDGNGDGDVEHTRTQLGVLTSISSVELQSLSLWMPYVPMCSFLDPRCALREPIS